nr:GNAT family N-acetyltransferase [Thalassobacillus sp. CUG 92003]
MTLENRIALWGAVLKQPLNGQIALVMETEDNHIIGFISGGKERTKNYAYDGEIYAIYLLDEYQRKGLGSQLLAAFTEAMVNADYQSMLVWVLTYNPSGQFYIQHGAKQVEAEQVTIGEGTYEETAYGWKDINDLLSRLQ